MNNDDNACEVSQSHLIERLGLKPCPFCGSDDLYVSKDDRTGVGRWVSCNKCECDGPLGSKLVDPVAWWNNRP